MTKRMVGKLNSKKAFTLAETLLAVLILLMVTVVVATGMPVVKNAYEKVVMASNADVLLSTAMSMLRNELGTALDVDTLEDGQTVTYYSGTRGIASRLYVGGEQDDRQEIMFRRYDDVDGLNSSQAAAPLVSVVASTGDLYVTYDSVEITNGIITFTNLSVNRESGATGIAKRDSFSIRVISE